MKLKLYPSPMVRNLNKYLGQVSEDDAPHLDHYISDKRMEEIACDSTKIQPDEAVVLLRSKEARSDYDYLRGKALLRNQIWDTIQNERESEKEAILHYIEDLTPMFQFDMAAADDETIYQWDKSEPDKFTVHFFLLNPEGTLLGITVSYKQEYIEKLLQKKDTKHIHFVDDTGFVWLAGELDEEFILKGERNFMEDEVLKKELEEKGHIFTFLREREFYTISTGNLDL